jgi:hypothetical protein
MASGLQIDRRGFVRRVALGASSALALAGGAAGQAAPTPAARKSKVVIARHPGLTIDGKVQAEPMAQAIDRAVLELAGEKSVEQAWARYFMPEERVGIKVNGRGGVSLATSKPMLTVCVARLKAIGVKPENIIIWDSLPSDLASCGLNLGGEWGVKVLPAYTGWDAPVEQGAFRGALTKIVTQQVDAILNLPVLKDHVLCGVTLALKNHFGSINNPQVFHTNNCDPFVADLNCVPALRDKHRLVLCDAARSQPEGGPHYRPQYRWFPNFIMAATDPVAHDEVGRQLLEARRKELNLPPLPRVGRPPTYLQTAADRGLGTNQPERIERVEVHVA